LRSPWSDAAGVSAEDPPCGRAMKKKAAKEFWVHEIKHDGFRLMVRPAALSRR
jgi:ATP-dependent DNA ligase